MSICKICKNPRNEGNVCHNCRQIFVPLAESIYDFTQCLTCDLCDKYNFPCLNCAKYAFEYNLGSGNGQIEEFENINDSDDNGEEPLNPSQMLRVLSDTYEQSDNYNNNNNNNNNATVIVVESDIVLESVVTNDESSDVVVSNISEFNEAMIYQKKKKRGYYNKYCIVQ